jgi:phage gp29-like protein
MITLYDGHGNKIDRGKLRDEESAPSLRSVRQPLSSYPSTGLTPYKLANILRLADQGDPHAQCELFEDMEEKDLHLLSVLATRRRAVAGLELKVEEPAGANAQEKRAADLVREHLAGMESINEILFDVLDAVGKGYSASEIIWGIHKQEAIIKDIKWREPKWFRFDQDTLSELRLVDGTTPFGKELTPYKYITHFHRAKSGLPVRGGILRPCTWMYLFKNYTVKDWIIFAEIYAQPLRVGKYPISSSEPEKDVLLQAVANMGTDAAAIIPETMLIEFVESQGKQGSTDLYERLARFCDEQMSKGIIGQTLSADAKATGMGSGVADLQGEVRRDIKISDARQLSGTLSRDIARPLIDLNMGPVDRYPKICVIVEDADDLTELAANVKTMVEVGLPVPTAWAYKKFNIPAPEKGEAVLGSTGSPTGSTGAPTGSTSPTTGSTSPTKTAANAQGRPRPDSVAPVADQLEKEAAPITDAMINQVRGLLDEVADLSEFADRLPELLADMDTNQMTEVMARAFAAADLTGQHEVSQGN